MDLQFRTYTVDGWEVLAVAGEIDLATAPQLQTVLLEAVHRQQGRLVLDMSKITFMDASGIAALVHVARQAQWLGGQVRIAQASPLVARVLQITGVDHWLSLHTDVKAALAATTPAVSLIRAGESRDS